MASWQARQRDPLLDQNTQAMLERRGRELLGLVLLAVAVVFFLIFASYSPEDPGWMVATEEPAHNLFGRLGSGIASTLVIIAGRAVWALPVLFLAWGLRFVTHRGADRAMARMVFGVIAVALCAVYAATLEPGQGWPHTFGLGGLFGDTVLGAMLGVTPVNAGIGLKILSLVLGVAMVAMLLFVTGFDMAEIRIIRQFLLVGSVIAYNAALTAAGKGAQGAGLAAARWQERQRDRRAAAVDAVPRPAVMAAEAAPSQGLVRRSRQMLIEEEPPEAAPTAWGRAAPLRADPRYVEPLAEQAQYAQPREKLSLLARVPGLMRRAPEPELVEPAPLPLAAAEAPSPDRISNRIAEAVRSRTKAPVQGLTPLQAAIQSRREPPMARPRGPVPLVADTRRPPAPLPRAERVEPPVAAPAATPQPMPAGRPAMTSAMTAAMAAAANTAAARMAPPALTAASFRAAAGGLDPAAVRDAAGWTGADRGYDDGYDDGRLDDDADWQADEAFAGAMVEDAALDDAILDDAGSYDEEPAYDPQPVRAAPPRAVVAVDPRRAVVQPQAARKPALSTRAVQEAQPRLQFDEPAQAYELPPLSLLTNPTTVQRHTPSNEALEENARMLESVLDDYGVKGEIVSVRPGPVVTMYELEPAPGLKASRVIGLADDIARSMSALSARVSTVPGRSVIGIELPNVHREKVVLREILAARDFGDTQMRLPLALGKDIGGDPIVANLAKMPHLLIAGTTGSGKSVAINTMILSLLYKLTPEECRLIMIDPKMLELSVYDGIPHLLSPVVTDPKKAVVALKWVVGEMEERYRRMSKMGVRNIEGYNGRVREALDKGELFKRTIQTGFDEETGDPVFETEEFAPQPFPYIVVIVDEMADLMMVAGKEIEACIQRLAQMARASGIHLIMATQRPSVDVITGTIKANFPTRISFQVTSKIDSRTILGEQGAEQLLGMGDMLYMAGGGRISRIHGPFVSDEEVEEIVNHLKSFGPPTYMSGVVEGPDEDAASDIDAVLGLNAGGNTDGEDALYDQAVAIVAKDRKCSTSYIQRKLGIGYNKAARLVEQMEEQGVVTPANHVGKREILIPET